jgi:hypothetical protein
MPIEDPSVEIPSPTVFFKTGETFDLNDMINQSQTMSQVWFAGIKPIEGEVGDPVDIYIASSNWNFVSPLEILDRGNWRIAFGARISIIRCVFPENGFIIVNTTAPNQSQRIIEVEVTIDCSRLPVLTRSTDLPIFRYIRRSTSDSQNVSTETFQSESRLGKRHRSENYGSQESSQQSVFDLGHYSFSTNFAFDIDELTQTDSLQFETAFLQIAKKWRHKKDPFGRSIAFYFACKAADSEKYARLYQTMLQAGYNDEDRDNFGLRSADWIELFQEKKEPTSPVVNPEAPAVRKPVLPGIFISSREEMVTALTETVDAPTSTPTTSHEKVQEIGGFHTKKLSTADRVRTKLERIGVTGDSLAERSYKLSTNELLLTLLKEGMSIPKDDEIADVTIGNITDKKQYKIKLLIVHTGVCFHTALAIGSKVLQWNDSSLCQIDTKPHQKALLAVDIAFVQIKDISIALEKLVTIIAAWNGFKDYSVGETNCQHFVDDCLLALNITPKYQPMMDAYVHYMRENGFAMYEIPLLDFIKDAMGASLSQFSTHNQVLEFESHDQLETFACALMDGFQEDFSEINNIPPQHREIAAFLKAYDRHLVRNMRREQDMIKTDKKPIVVPRRATEGAKWKFWQW